MEKVTKVVVDGVDMMPIEQLHYILNQIMTNCAWGKRFPHLEANGQIDMSEVRKNKKLRAKAITQFYYEVSSTLSDLQEGKAFELWSNDDFKDESTETI